jgi:hypothetical protein
MVYMLVKRRFRMLFPLCLCPQQVDQSANAGFHLLASHAVVFVCVNHAAKQILQIVSNVSKIFRKVYRKDPTTEII